MFSGKKWTQICIFFYANSDIDAAEVINILKPRQHGRHFPDDIFQWIFLNENVWI